MCKLVKFQEKKVQLSKFPMADYLGTLEWNGNKNWAVHE